jgi:hypothetical protein
VRVNSKCLIGRRTRRCNMRRMGLFLTGCLVGLLAGRPTVVAFEGEREPPSRQQDPLERMRQRYERLPGWVLKIVEPVEVKEILYLKDGGSTGLLLIDAKKQERWVCLDASGRRPCPLVFNARFPHDPKGIRAALGSPEEAAFYGLMLRWARKHPMHEALLNYDVHVSDAKYPELWQLQSFMERLESRFRYAPPSPPPAPPAGRSDIDSRPPPPPPPPPRAQRGVSNS